MTALPALSYETSVSELLADVQREAATAYAPRTPLSIAAWAEEHRVLPSSSSSEGGRFRNDRIPYLKGIMDALTDPRIQTVVVMKGAQVAGTTIGENWVGWTMDEAPAPMLSVWPTEKLLRRWSMTRLDPMIDETPRLARLFDRSGLRDSNDAIAHKEFPNGTLDLLTARSSSDLRSISAARIWFSEVDNIIAELSEDGDPIELARSRGETFWDYKEYFESTPTVSGSSRIYDELTRSTWNDWYMPCPHCEHEQVLRWRDGMEDGDDNSSGEARFVWDKDSAGEVVPGTVSYVCEECACLISEWEKSRMLAKGEWRPRHPGRLAEGFHIPAFISPLISWTRIAQRFSRAVRSPAKMRTFVNNICGLPYAEKSSAVSSSFLQQRAEVYRAQVPKGVRLLTCGGDVQGDSVHLTVWGFGAGEQSWVIDWKIIEGDPALEKTWREVGAYLQQGFTDEAGKSRCIAATCIDAKYQTGHVHRFARRFVGPNGAKVIPIQGKEGRGRPVIADPPKETRRRSGKNIRSRIVGIDTVKDMFFGRLLVKERGPEFVNFPAGLDAAFFLQLTAEELKTEYRNRRPIRVWRKKAKDLANEVLDTTVYAYAALVSLGSRVLQDLAKLAAAESAEVVSVLTSPSQAVTASQAPPRSRTRPRVVSKGVY
jgi:phage terminase large subunit GpA-like protein